MELREKLEGVYDKWNRWNPKELINEILSAIRKEVEGMKEVMCEDCKDRPISRKKLLKLLGGK